MGTLADKLVYLNGTKVAIHDAIEAQGVSIPSGAPFRDYPIYIDNIDEAVWVENDYSTTTGDGTLAEKLLYLNETKQFIHDAIENQGVSIPSGTPFRDYAIYIGNI